MTKELVICIIIIVLIFTGDFITQNYTKNSVSQASESLGELRGELFDEEINWKNVEDKIEMIQSNWNHRHKKLAYYIEHDELEKVETDLNGLKGYIEMNEEKESVAELDRTVYVLEHIKNKNVFSLENIF